MFAADRAVERAVDAVVLLLLHREVGPQDLLERVPRRLRDLVVRREGHRRHGLLHILQADHSGIEGDVGFFCCQVDAHVHDPVQLLEGDLQRSHAHGADHAAYLQYDLLVDYVVAGIPDRLFDVDERDLLRVVLYRCDLGSQIDLCPGDSVQVFEGLLDGCRAGGTDHSRYLQLRFPILSHEFSLN